MQPAPRSSGRPSAADRIEAALREEIATGGTGPGARMDETRLATRFGASRTPVREALARLAAQGVLVPGPGRGLRVADYDRDDLAQMFEAMYEIEAACARMAAQRLTLLGRARLEAAFDACLATAETGDVGAYMRANEAFHLVIYEATGNRFMAEMATDFRRRTGPFRARRFGTREDLIASARSHRGLLDVIGSADGDAAEGGMRAHMTDSFLKVLAVNDAVQDALGAARRPIAGIGVGSGPDDEGPDDDGSDPDGPDVTGGHSG
ncbi:MAG: GntR family transcriptional regulator [Paracoccaceae bacterium]